ncbi:16S rRNA (cytosine(1402)-N(4))-methyltransferase RsmH [Howardella ureilytica]|nr:16S rRNA (cytosine(1402)-N(4))-methyltransferase RsmH [Lachnospiraceae bacterium]MDY2956361.1 16S rRNA (cytosine(1402)-N(4))-methyltransferase RsmH [Lachnospiraceae bacterium]
MEFSHIPVMRDETINSLNIKPDGTYVDGTLGGAGHSMEILKRLGPSGRLICFDQDAEAIESSSKKLDEYRPGTIFIHSNFEYMPEKLREHGITGVDGIMLDLGVSSHQLDVPERGFSYRFDAPLDMRMDNRVQRTAADIVNEESVESLTKIIKEYGEEKYARKIAHNIDLARKNKRIETTFELNDIIRKSMPAKSLATGGHPSKRTFQALRIALNDELNRLEGVIPKMIDLLNDKGRLSIITFHSLEDRIVKNAFRNAQNPCTCPSDFPVCVCGKKSKGTVITKKAIVPSEEELEHNSRAKSAKLRVFERVMYQGEER